MTERERQRERQRERERGGEEEKGWLTQSILTTPVDSSIKT